MSIGEYKAKVKTQEKRPVTRFEADSLQIDGLHLPLGYRAGERSIFRVAPPSVRFNQIQQNCTRKLLT
jgi:hypothetical protein